MQSMIDMTCKNRKIKHVADNSKINNYKVKTKLILIKLLYFTL